MAAVEYAVMLLTISGIVLLFFLCTKSPRLHRSGKSKASMPRSAENYAKISVIIPTRNSAHELSALLADLHNQNLEPIDIICVDMHSTDNTVMIAQRLGARVIPFNRKPVSDLSRGDKMLAYQQGVSYSRGDYFVFLQPNLRMAPETMSSFLSAYRKTGQPLSLRPYHMIRRPYENLAMLVYYFGAFSKGIGIPKRSVGKGFDFFDDALVFSRYHWELFTAEETQQSTPWLSGASMQAYDADCTALQVGVAMMPPENDNFRSAVMAHKSPRYYDDEPEAEPAFTFSTTSAAGYAVDEDELLAMREARDLPLRGSDSYDWMRQRFTENKMGLHVMLGSRLLRCRNYPNGFRRFIDSMSRQIAKDRHSSNSSLHVLVALALLTLTASVFSIIYGAKAHQPWLILFGLAAYVTIAIILRTKSRLIGSYHPMMCAFFPLPLLFYILCSVAALFIPKEKDENKTKKRPTDKKAPYGA